MTQNGGLKGPSRQSESDQFRMIRCRGDPELQSLEIQVGRSQPPIYCTRVKFARTQSLPLWSLNYGIWLHASITGCQLTQ